MRNTLTYLAVFGGFLFFSSCEKVAFEPPKIEGQVSFMTDVTPILNNSCSSCHSRDHDIIFKSQPDFYKKLAEVGFLDSVNSTSSKIYKKLTTDASHQQHLSSDNLAKILLWFEQGAKNN